MCVCAYDDFSMKFHHDDDNDEPSENYPEKKSLLLLLLNNTNWKIIFFCFIKQYDDGTIYGWLVDWCVCVIHCIVRNKKPFRSNNNNNNNNIHSNQYIGC